MTTASSACRHGVGWTQLVLNGGFWAISSQRLRPSHLAALVPRVVRSVASVLTDGPAQPSVITGVLAVRHRDRTEWPRFFSCFFLVMVAAAGGRLLTCGPWGRAAVPAPCAPQALDRLIIVVPDDVVRLEHDWGTPLVHVCWNAPERCARGDHAAGEWGRSSLCRHCVY